MSEDCQSIQVDGKVYDISILRQIYTDVDAVRIIVPVYIFNDESFHIFRACIESIKKYTQINHEIWVVDNNSPPKFSSLLTQFEGINLVINHTEPINPHKQISGGNRKWKNWIRSIIGNLRNPSQLKDGSYANAIGLELACRVIDEETKLLFTMHSDTLILKAGWLSYLKSKMTERIRGVACLKDKIRVNALHISGLLFDYTLFKELKMDFLPNIRQSLSPDIPEYDVGDLITIRLLEHSYEVFTCKNTYNKPSLVESIPAGNPLRELHSDRCFDDESDIFYIHMGRGTLKAKGTYHQVGKTYPKQWINFAERFVL
jgi:hypothetical protein